MQPEVLEPQTDVTITPPETPQARPLDQIVADIHRDAASDTADFLKQSEVPFGGE